MSSLDPPIPDNESQRLESLHSLNLLYSPSEERFDRITRLASRTLGTPYAEINLIDEEQQWSKSQCGSVDPDTPREDSFCARTMLNQGVTIIPDARQHEVFSDNPHVTGEPHIHFYMSHRLLTPEGHPAGTLCVFDPEPREPSDEDVEVLRDLTAIAQSELEKQSLSEEQEKLLEKLERQERKASIDGLTKVWRRERVVELLKREHERALRNDDPLGLCMLDLDHFKRVNDTYGHPAGDTVLRSTAKRIRKCLRSYDALGRYGGEEFLILLIETGREAACGIAERVRTQIASRPVRTSGNEVEVTASLGLSILDTRDPVPPETLLEQADRNLYRAKDRGRNCVVPDTDNP